MKKSLGYLLGQAFAITVGVCLSAITLGVTVKILMWILG